MRRWIRVLGSLTIAAPLLVAIAAVLAWGTIYEARFGTAAVQRFVYHAWWFQALLGFLALNLAVAALERYPWKRQHTPFVLAHIGIILILLGGILGGRFGIEGQMVIPEGQAERVMETPGNVLVIHQPNPGLHEIVPTRFDSQAWVHEPNAAIPVRFGQRAIQLTVDRYYPDAVTEEDVSDGSPSENPAVHILLTHDQQQQDAWLLARDPERFGMGWGEAHVLFLEPSSEAQMAQLLGRGEASMAPRGVLSVKVPGLSRPREIPVPDEPNQPIRITGTAYTLTLKDYFPDFAITGEGPVSRTNEPNNPAVSFTLDGPEGTDVYLLFALHPEFQSIHGFAHRIAADVTYTHASGAALAPNGIGIVREPSGRLMAVMTDGAMQRRLVDPLEIGTRYTHPSLGYHFELVAYYPRAKVSSRVLNRSNEVHAEMIHVVSREAEQQAEAWVGLRQSATLSLGSEPLLVEYRPARLELPFTVKLLDFRKIDYPGTQMAAAFESDVELTDARRGIILMRKISMNNPLRYRGFSLFQSSYVPGDREGRAVETTILSVRNDPGTPFVYAGFLIVIAGVVSMFVLRTDPGAVVHRPKKPSSPRRRSALP